MQLPIVEKSETFIIVSLNGINNDKALLELNPDEDLPDDALNVHRIGQIIYYIKRAGKLEELCLADFATCYERCSKKEGSVFYVDVYIQSSKHRQYFKQRATPKILGNYLPYSYDGDRKNKRDVTLFTLFHNFRMLQELRTWHEATQNQRCFMKQNLERHRPHEVRDINLLYDSNSDNDSVCSLGDSSVDEEKEPEYNIGDCVQHSPEMQERAYDMLMSGTQSLNAQQSKVLAILTKFFERARNGIPGIKILLQGKAGTGKSFLIKMATLLSRLNFNECQHPPVLRCAPTGVAADGISGETIHRTFGIPTTCKSECYYMNITDAKKCSIRQNLKKIQLLVIDEISMVGRLRWGQVNEGLKWAFENTTLPFGGVTCLFTGKTKLLLSRIVIVLLNVVHCIR